MSTLFARLPLALLLVCAISAPAAAQLIPGWDTKQFTFEQIDANTIRLMREVEVNGEAGGPNAGQQIFADELLVEIDDRRVHGGRQRHHGVTHRAPVGGEASSSTPRAGSARSTTAAGQASLGQRGAMDKSMFGTLEPDIMFCGRDDREDRRRQIPDHQRLVHDLRAADAAVGDRHRHRDHQPRGLRDPAQRGHPREGRAGLLPAGALLPDSERRSRDRLPAADLRQLALSRAVAEQRVLLGDQSQPGPDAVPRLVHQDRAGRGRRVSLRRRRRDPKGSFAPIGSGRRQRRSISRAAAPQTLAGRPQLRRSAARSRRCCRPACAPAPASTTSPICTTQQLYNTNIYEASHRQRTIDGSVAGAWGSISVTGNIPAHASSSTIADRIDRQRLRALGRPSTCRASALATLPFYVVGEQRSRATSSTRIGAACSSRTSASSRFDATPTFRAALSNWPFLNVNGTVAYRYTYFSESLNSTRRPGAGAASRAATSISRADLVGPVFSRVFTPNNALADRLKHVIEPNFSIQRITDFDTLDAGGDARRAPTTRIIPASTRINYGLTNRVLVRKAPADPKASALASAPRELLSVQLTQSYYTDSRASRYDNTYQSTSYNPNARASNFSPVALTARTAPTAFTNGDGAARVRSEGSARCAASAPPAAATIARCR